MKKILLLTFRLLLLGGGIAALVFFINEAGPAEVWHVIRISAPWLPLVILLEGAWVSWDVLLVRSLYGEAGKRVPVSLYIRSGLIAYPFMALLPAGRAGAEAARAATLSAYVGGGRASAVAFQSQAAGLAGNFLVSALGVIVCASVLGFRHWITYLLAINGIVALVLATLIFLGIRGRLGGFLGKRFESLKESGHTFDRHIKSSPVFPPAAIFYSWCGRMTQFVQYVFFVAAVGGGLTFLAGAVAQAIHIVGALVGDLVPAQLGVTDGAYAVAATTTDPAIFGLSGTAAEIAPAMLGIALLGRIAQLFWSLVGALTPLFWKIQPEREAEVKKFATSHFLESVGAADDEERTIDNTPDADADPDPEPASGDA